jgi:hypothetical protein
MAASLVVIGEKLLEDAIEAPLAEDDDEIEALATERANQAFDVRILPRTSWRGEDFLDAEPGTRATGKGLHPRKRTKSLGDQLRPVHEVFR